MTVTTTNQDPAPPGEAPPRRQRPPTARTRRTGRPRSRYSPRDVHAPVRRSFGAAMRPVLPYFVAYVVIGIALARWEARTPRRATSPSPGSGSRCRSSWPSPTSSWCRSWRSSGCSAGCAATAGSPSAPPHLYLHRRRFGPRPSCGAAPPLVRPRGHTRPQRRVHRLRVPRQAPSRRCRGPLVLGHRTTTAPEHRVGQGTARAPHHRCHGYPARRADGARSGYDRLAELLATPAAATEEAAPVGWVRWVGTRPRCTRASARSSASATPGRCPDRSTTPGPGPSRGRHARALRTERAQDRWERVH